MKLVFIAPMLSPVGGLERTLSDKANWLVAHGHEVTLLSYRNGEEKIYYPLDERVRHIDINCHIFSLYHMPVYARPLRYIKLRKKFRERLSQVLADVKPDVVVITIPNVEDFIHDMFKVCRGIRVVIESHLASVHHMAGKSLTERVICQLFPAIKSIKKANLLVALTRHDANIWQQRGVQHIRIVPNPITSDADNLTDVPRKPARIIAVGRLFEQKRIDRLIDAFSLLAAKFPAWTLEIFGDGPLRELLQQQIESLHLIDRIHLNLPTHQIFEEYQRSQFFVLSSDFEGFGLVITEAMSCGIPVVATDCPYGPSEIIEDGKTGLLAKMDVQDLADKMEWMITHEVERQQMGINAHKAAARYKLDVVMPQWEQAYQSVLFPEM